MGCEAVRFGFVYEYWRLEERNDQGMNMRWLGILLVVVLGLDGSFVRAEDQKPNLVVILCDDLGAGDLACFGHPFVQTPNLDRMANEGVKLTRCYAASAVCSASRAGLITGKFPNRTGVYDWIPEGHVVHLKESETTIAESLRKGGYWTGHVGKWHLNGMFNTPGQPGPGEHGFLTWMATQNNASPSHKNPQNFVKDGTGLGVMDGCSCQIVADQAVKWIGERAKEDDPFFLWVCFHEPHEPVASPEELVQKYVNVAKDVNEAEFFANVENMDRAVGRILEAIDGAGIGKETLIVFTSDNGPETLLRYPGAKRSYGRTNGLRGMKLHMYEGGIRVPGIARWTGTIEAGRVESTPVCSVDLHPTFCELAGVSEPKGLDGVSLVKLFEGEKFERTKPLFWTYYRAISEPRSALVEGDWKIVGMWDGPELRDKGDKEYGSNVTSRAVEVLKSAQLVEFELYNLKEDPSEEVDVKEKNPDVYERMKKRLVEVYRGVQADSPVWEMKN